MAKGCPPCIPLTRVELASLVVHNFPAGIGIDGQDIQRVAFSNAMCESGACPCDVGAAGELGLWQIHPVHFHKFPGWDLFDPERNAMAAVRVWEDAGRLWQPWSVYTNGCYFAWMEIAREAIAQVQINSTEVILNAIKYCCYRYGVPLDAVASIIQSTSGGIVVPCYHNPNTGAVGLMGIVSIGAMPTRDRLCDPAVNICWGCKILRECYEACNGDPGCAMIAYAIRNKWEIPTELKGPVLVEA